MHETAENYQAQGQGEQVQSTAQSINGKKIGCLKLFILSHFMFETCSNPQTQVMVADQPDFWPRFIHCKLWQRKEIRDRTCNEQKFTQSGTHSTYV